tara:strand:+ start:736 stop:1143 length:408 start_codon:yes stop_codon:yes gene_type:complete
MKTVCKSQYLKPNDILLYEKLFISHDGYDAEGPDNNLYDYLLIIKRENELLFEIFHREYYYNQKFDNEPFNLHDYNGNECIGNNKPFSRSVIGYLDKYRDKPSQQQIMHCFITNEYHVKHFKDFTKYLRLPQIYQ